jgi:ribonuclease P/MRP protein subunit POP5
MNQVPTPSKDGRSCIFRVVRVSGTIRKAEEEAVRRARAIMLRAQRELGEKSGALLENLLKAPGGLEVQSDRDALMADASDEGDYDSD